MVSHTIGDIAYHGGPTLVRPYYVGAAGVDLFFVISGFVMIHSASPLFGEPGGWRTFLARRLARIVPLYWLATAAYAAIQIGQGKWAVVAPRLMAASLVFWPLSDADGLHLPVYSIGWTLDYEMAFYVAFALVLPFRPGVGPIILACGLGLLVLAGSATALPQPLRFWSHPIILEFLFGLGLGLLYRRGVRLGRPAAATAMFVAAGIFAGATLAGYNAVPNVPEAFPRCLAWGIPAALLFAGLVLARQERARPARRWLVRLGDASYAIYLLHVIVIVLLRPLRLTMEAWLGGRAHLAGWLELAAVAAVTIPGALFLHRFVERPALRLLARRRHRLRGLEPTRVYTAETSG